MNPDEFMKRLQESDQRTLERRAQRFKELAQIQTDGRLFASQRVLSISENGTHSFTLRNRWSWVRIPLGAPLTGYCLYLSNDFLLASVV